MKNRTIIGIVCIVLALILTFAIAPLVNKMAESRVDIVRMKNDVIQGHQISENDVETVKVGGYNLPADVIQKKENVVRQDIKSSRQTGIYKSKLKISGIIDLPNVLIPIRYIAFACILSCQINLRSTFFRDHSSP